VEFRLVYEGPLRSNGDIKHKQEIRRVLHSQLKELWQQSPLKDNSLLIEPNSTSDINILKPVAPFIFAPLVCEKMRLIAEIDITLLRPEPPGSIVTQAGDIDNRLKTLFDALRMPTATSELSKGDTPQQGENPFFCLLEDDNLISKLTVSSDRLLKPVSDTAHVVLIIRVVTVATLRIFKNASLP